MKKVLYIITKSNWGGAQRYVYDLATHLPRDRFEPVVAFGPAPGTLSPGELGKRLREAGIRTICLPSLGRDMGMSDIGAFGDLRHLIRAERPDVLHLNSSKVGGLGALAGRLSGVARIIYTAHGWAFYEARSPLSRALIWLASVATVALSHVTICVSEHDRRALSSLPLIGRKLVRIYNGIDLPMALGTGERVRDAFPPGTRITGTIGELTANKNQASLIGAARRDPALNVAIVGEGEDRALLQRLIDEGGVGGRVKLFGYIPAADALKGFDAFALPSRKEGLPYILLEARAAGLPIEANRVGGVGEALDLPLPTFSLERMLSETIRAYRG